MTCKIRLLFCLHAALCTAAASAQAAYVYVQTAKGVNLYDASSTGKLTLVSGSPFQTTGMMIGSNGTHFITLGTDHVHSYPVAGNSFITGFSRENSGALNNAGTLPASGKLHVYTVIASSAVEAAGSPYPIGAEGLVVVPK